MEALIFTGSSASDASVVVCLSNNYYCIMNKVTLSLSRMFIWLYFGITNLCGSGGKCICRY